MHGKTTIVGADRDLDRLVRSAWEAVLPAVPFDPAKSWRDVGVDSLKALEFVLRLERALDRKIAFDGMDPESTAGDLMRLLAVEGDVRPASSDRRPRIFFVPGLTGDDQAQAAFRQAFRREAAFDLLATDIVETSSRVLGDIAARADLLVGRLVRIQPAGDIRLAGYSIGGLVAQEMTRRLEAAGRVVSLLIVLDGLLTAPFSPPSPRPDAGSKPPRPRPVERAKRALSRLIGPAMQRLGLYDSIRTALTSRSLRDRRWARAQITRLQWGWGFGAMRDWRPRPCDAPTLLVASDAFWTFSSIETWRALCPNLRLVQTPGDHADVLAPAAAALIEPALLSMLAASSAVDG